MQARSSEGLGALVEQVKPTPQSPLRAFTGATASPPGLDERLRACRRRAIDVVVVWKFDRFARSLKNPIAGLEWCRALGIDFVSVTEAVDTSLPAPSVSHR
jgi:hypothetical protein